MERGGKVEKNRPALQGNGKPRTTIVDERLLHSQIAMVTGRHFIAEFGVGCKNVLNKYVKVNRKF